MSVIGKRVIYVGYADSEYSKPLNVEGKAIAAVLAGTIVEQVASGLQANANAATVFGQRLLIADKDQMRSRSVDDAWTINENMVSIALRSGEAANVLVAAGNNITSSGTPLSLDGTGKLKIASPATEQVLCFSDEIINVTADALVRVVPA